MIRTIHSLNVLVFFFFSSRRRHTRSKRDWSSDVCSSDLDEFEAFPGRITTEAQNFGVTTPLGLEEWMVDTRCLVALGDGIALNYATQDREIGRASCRERVVMSAGEGGRSNEDREEV